MNKKIFVLTLNLNPNAETAPQIAQAIHTMPEGDWGYHGYMEVERVSQVVAQTHPTTGDQIDVTVSRVSKALLFFREEPGGIALPSLGALGAVRR